MNPAGLRPRQPWHITYVDLDPRCVDYVEVDDVPAEIPTAWQRLEGTVGELRGRRFVGAFDARAGRYRACVETRPAAEPLPGLERGELPGGRYARIRLRLEPPALYEEIPAAFDHLTAHCSPDEQRPSLELYRRHDWVDALLPVIEQVAATR